MLQIEVAIHYLALGMGYGLMCVGGLTLFAASAWWCLDKVAARLGWARLFYRHSRTIMAAERARQDRERLEGRDASP
ncbi:hypothetical protein EBE87_15785 [Pseudoroseomonas wenyumeiae]|uniref:Uncharacterized protein n=1 Tax=Teichococcus wenyumeiae TaxID=2478470 RepID=A0A3A9JTG8_9PROT|nr:hypothetical protein [Pseudoroseomonas wenyumeiae]RKK04008.1 hypothetical protein D6Z83_11695 [Pseudoroseomonas wenyumeiae]RMI19406.1 hypothetical protein EBE87_20645 [Pseudoroseomonas wenyumeiae]RMI20283.1 hypothetical protein EBE87_15785 [Pseudoroseomonas wenyumeiae]